MSKIWRILPLIFLLAVLSLNVHAQAATTADLQAELEELVDSWSDGSAVSARLTVGDETWAAASGLVDQTGSEAATPDSRFRIGSISKLFAAVVVLQLVDEGALSLDQTPADFLDDAIISQIANADTATIYQLLTMTSGIAEYLGDDIYETMLANPTHAWTAAESLEYAYGWDASFEPGEDYEYSNTNYLLLQLIIEKVTGKPFHEVLRQRVLDPADLKDTYSQGAENLPGGFVHGYEDFDEDGTAEDVTAINDGWGMADGGLISTTADLTKLYSALFSDKTLLSPAMLAIMTDGGEYEYGTGVGVTETDDGLIYSHSGAVSGFTGEIAYAVDHDAIVVVLYASINLGDDDTGTLFALLEAEPADE